jgi:demethylmenaquinone methyltransferase/2-methoxy-6-polyprenyl-1,4-benzoquinol methylase
MSRKGKPTMTKKSSTDEKVHQVNDLFNRISRYYDLMNRLISAGQDVRWRKQVIRMAELEPGSQLLDVGAGTGDLTRMALRRQSGVRALAVDFSLGMMRASRAFSNLPFVAADAMHLPFANASMDVVVSGFLLRNVKDINQVVREQRRVLKQGGKMIALDTTRPKKNLLTPFIWMHMHLVIPLLGWLLTRDWEAYRYFADSTEHFLTAEDLTRLMEAEGVREVHFERRMFGTIAIHWGKK